MNDIRKEQMLSLQEQAANCLLMSPPGPTTVMVASYSSFSVFLRSSRSLSTSVGRKTILSLVISKLINQQSHHHNIIICTQITVHKQQREHGWHLNVWCASICSHKCHCDQKCSNLGTFWIRNRRIHRLDDLSSPSLTS